MKARRERENSDSHNSAVSQAKPKDPTREKASQKREKTGKRELTEERS